MLTPPADLSESDLVAALAYGWGLTVDGLRYQPVGWGSHHWAASDTDGTRWFVTVDELEQRLHTRDELLDAAFARLIGALSAARALADAGRSFAVAPHPALGGEPVRRMGPTSRFALAVYPQVEGESFAWGHTPSAEHRSAVLDMVVAVHTAPTGVRNLAPVDDFAVPYRDELDAALRGDQDTSACGPYAVRTAQLVAEHARPIAAALDRYDGMVGAVGSTPARAVLTHGEPHAGNTMRTAEGWVLVDWDTARIAPPERDLWMLEPGDGSALATYTEATSYEVHPEVLDLYRRRWSLADIALEVTRFRRRHIGSAEDEQTFRLLSEQVAELAD